MECYILDCSFKFGNITKIDTNISSITSTFSYFGSYKTKDNYIKNVLIEKSFFNFKKEYFKDYDLYINGDNIQKFYDEYKENKTEEIFSEFSAFFILGIIVDEEYLFYIKLKHPEILEKIEIRKLP